MPMTSRALLERLSRGWSFKRRLPAPFGRCLRVSGDSMLKYLDPRPSRAFDPMLLRFALDEIAPNALVWDIGANVGVFSAAASARSGADGRVLAIEADPWLASLLRQTSLLGRAEDAPIDVLSVAIAGGTSVMRLNIARRGRASNWLDEMDSRSQSGGSRNSVLVPTYGLDKLAEITFHPDVVKIDIEGAELTALRSATRVLQEVRPIWLIEVGDPQRDEATRLLRDAGYRLFDGGADSPRETPVEACTFNTLAIPD